MIRRLSVRWRITLVAAGLFAVALGLASFVLVREVRSNLVDGIRSNEDYLRLMSYLQGLPVIRGMVPVRAAPDALVVELDLLTGMPGLKSTIARGDVLLAEEDTPVLHLR